MVALALLEIYSGLQWLTDPYAAETELSGILAECGCGTATPCGSGAACRAYGRLMAFALFGLAMVECVAVRAMCGPIVVVSRDFDLINPARCPQVRFLLASDRGFGVWMAGSAMHAVESVFWWREAYNVALPRLRALPLVHQSAVLPGPPLCHVCLVSLP